MRPRLIAVDDVTSGGQTYQGYYGFNEATADRRG